MPTHIVIPARLGSTRLPEKVLADIAGLPMVIRSYQQAVKAGADTVMVATDSRRVFDVCEQHGASVVMTDPAHPSGTTRLSEVVQQQGWAFDDIVVGMQADEPLLPPEVLRHLMCFFEGQTSSPMASVYDLIHDPKALMDPSVVKVVLNADQQALYFSRAPIPWHREAFASTEDLTHCPTEYYRHIGIYAYQAGFLTEYMSWEPSPLEQVECLEQLRVLYHGRSIAMDKTPLPVPPGIDTPADLEQLRALMTSPHP